MDDIEDEEVDEQLTLGPPASTPSKLARPKEKPRQEQLDYQKALPYETESLEVMDARLEEILRSLVDCVRAKD